MAIDRALGKPVRQNKPISAVAGSASDLFELPALPDDTQIGDRVSDDYFELPIHQVLYSGDLDLSEVMLVI